MNKKKSEKVYAYERKRAEINRKLIPLQRHLKAILNYIRKGE